MKYKYRLLLKSFRG